MTQTLHPKSFFIPAFLWLGAFVCALYPVNQFQLEFFMAATVLMFTWTAMMLFRDVDTGWTIPRSAVLRLAGAFWVLVLASCFWSEIKPVSIVAACFFSFLPLTFFSGVVAAREDYFVRLVKPLAVIFAVMALWAVFQFFFLNSYFMGQARHPLADPSSLGALFSLALFCTLGWMVSDRPTVERKASLVLSILLVCGIMSTASRGAPFAFVPGIALFALLLWPRIRASRKFFLILIIAAGAFYGLMQTGAPKALDIGDRMFDTLTAPVGAATQNRIDVWTATVNMIKDRPLLGTGIGTFFLYYPEYRLPSEVDGVYLAHNDPMQFWVELGILGPVLFYAFVIAATLRSFKALKRVPKDSKERIVIVTIMSALAAMVVHTHVSFNFYNLSILALAGVLLSVWFHATRKALAEDESVTIIALPDNMPHNLNKALVALPLLMMGWLFLSITGGEYLTNKARDAMFKQDMEAFMVNVNKADQVSMRLNFRAFLFAVNVPMAILEDRKSTLNEEQQRKLFEQVQWYMEDVLALNPRSASAYYYMAKVQSLVAPAVLPQNMETPEELYREAIRLDPMHLGARKELLGLYKQQGKSVKEQIALLEPVVRYRFASEGAIGYYTELSRLYLEDGSYDKSKQMLGRLYSFKQRSNFSLKRQNTSIPQAIMGGEEIFNPQ